MCPVATLREPIGGDLLSQRAEAVLGESRARIAALAEVIDRCLATVAGLDRGTGAVPIRPSTLAHGIVVDAQTMSVAREDGTTAMLTPTEWRVLAHLLRSHGRVVGKREMARDLFGLSDERIPEVEVYVSRLRDKLGGPRDSVVETVRGRGYRLRSL